MTGYENERYIPLDVKMMEKGLDITIDEGFGMNHIYYAQQQFDYAEVESLNKRDIVMKYIKEQNIEALSKYIEPNVTTEIMEDASFYQNGLKRCVSSVAIVPTDEYRRLKDIGKAEETISQISYRIMDYLNSGLLNEKDLIEEISKELDSYFTEEEQS